MLANENALFIVRYEAVINAEISVQRLIHLLKVLDPAMEPMWPKFNPRRTELFVKRYIVYREEDIVYSRS